MNRLMKQDPKVRRNLSPNFCPIAHMFIAINVIAFILIMLLIECKQYKIEVNEMT